MTEQKPGRFTGIDANSLRAPAGSLPGFLRERRSRLAPPPGAPGRRRTPGLRREEVAARAGVSVTWYTWLEQGRGGPPSDAVLERLVEALELDSSGREVLFLLAQQRPPPLTAAPAPALPASVQAVLDAMPTSPAFVKTPAWDIVAWNRAATVLLDDYAALPPRERNTLRRIFKDEKLRRFLPDWEHGARFILSVFRLELARTASPDAAALLAEMQATSADFRRLWAETEARTYGAGRKRVDHPLAGLITLDYSAFAVDGAEGLSMVVFTPATPGDVQAVQALLDGLEAG